MTNLYGSFSDHFSVQLMNVFFLTKSITCIIFILFLFSKNDINRKLCLSSFSKININITIFNCNFISKYLFLTIKA